jgi:hypothetical protein
MSIEPRWNVTGKSEKLGEKPIPMPLCSPHIPHTDPGANPGLHNERLGISRLSHGTTWDSVLYIAENFVTLQSLTSVVC